MIYLTGDFHGEQARFRAPALRKLRRGDTLILCGDFGFLWNGSQAEKKLLEWIGKRRYNVLFVEGTHDNLELLAQYPVEEWNGGRTHLISGRLRHLMRGERFSIEGKTLLALGGGQPDDNARMGISCWPGVLPTKEELLALCDRLDSYHWQLDLIVSHQAPTNIDGCLTHDLKELNLLAAFMNTLQRKNAFKVWCFGSYHLDRVIPPEYHSLYKGVYCAGGVKQGWLKSRSSQSSAPLSPSP